MTTSYPTSVDALTNPLSTDTLDSPSHSAQHANSNDAIEAIETELGTDPAGNYSTVAERLNSSCMVVTLSAVQSVASGFSGVDLLFNTVSNEDDETASLSLNTTTGVITVAHAGWYNVEAGVAFATNATGVRRIIILKGTTAMADAASTPGTSGVSGSITTARLMKLAAADTIKAQAAQASGSSLNATADERTFLAIYRVR